MKDSRYVEIGAQLDAHFGLTPSSSLEEVKAAFLRSVAEYSSVAKAIGITPTELCLWQMGFVARQL